MTEDKIKELINNYYKGKKVRQIVFWYDENQEHINDIDRIELNNVKIHKLTENNNFVTKKLLENDDTKSNYLIYAPFEKPANEENWFLDIILYSQEFTPDEAAIVSNELKITNIEVKRLVKKYLPFFKNKKRYSDFSNMQSEWTEENFEVSIIAVLAAEKFPNIDNILRRVFIAGLNKDNDYIEEFRKFSLKDKFWQLIKENFGYSSDSPNLKDLFISITLTALADKMREAFPAVWKKHLLNAKQSNSVVFVSNWMRDRELFEDFNDLISEIAEALRVKENLKNFDENIKVYAECDLFDTFDKTIIKYIIDSLINDIEDYKNLRDLISVRETKHWFNSFKNIYKSLESAILLFEQMKKYEKEFPVNSSFELIRAYANEYYKVDQIYRHFYTAFDNHEYRESDILRPIQEKVENLYTNKYLGELTKLWSDQVGQDLLETWQISGIEQQKNFYLNNIKNTINKDERSKVFVIISDAFRYECADELVSLLNKEPKIRGEAILEFMQGAVPSYTKLGMASLLPNKEISLNPGGEYLVNGMPANNLENREKVLINEFQDSKVIHYTQLKELSRDEARELLKSARVVYIYHDQVDSRGDSAKTEKNVFQAVQEAFNDIIDCVKRLVNNLSATSIFITTDHGFIYTRNPLEESDKVKLDKLEALEAKKRFILTKTDSKIPGTLTLDLDYILGKDSGYKVIIPKGHHRFKTQGAGINFVHGGASLQEIVIPLIKFKSQKVYKQEKVDIKLTNSNRKVTNNKFTLNFFQTEKVSDKVLPRSLKVALWDEDKQISDEKVLIADKTSDNAEDRELKIILTLKNIDYDKNKDYYLRLEEDTLIYEQTPFKISLAFTNDFDF